MEIEKYRKELTLLINSIKEHTDQILEFEKIPPSELQTILSKINHLYDTCLILNFLNEREESQKKEEGTVRSQTPEIKTSEKVSLDPLADINSTLKEKNDSQNSLNDRIGRNKLHASLSSKLQKNPINDLPKAIGINERFLFIKELFNNDSTAFTEAIKKLNNLQNFAEADHILHEELAVKYNWKSDSIAVQSFLELVQRRYI